MAILLQYHATRVSWISIAMSLSVGTTTPPGSLSLFNSLRALRQRGFYAAQANLHGPIFKTAQFHNKVICIADLSLAHRLFRDHADCIEPSQQVFTKDLDGGFLRFMEPSKHRQYGPLFRRALSRPILSESIPTTRALISRHLSQISDSGGNHNAILHLTRSIFARVLFGLEPSSSALLRFESLFASIALHTMAQRLDSQALNDLQQLRSLLRQPTQNICALSEMANQLGGEADNTAIDNLLFIQRISTDDAAGLLRWVIEFLGRNPQWLDQVRAKTEPLLPARIIKETLRLSRSEYLYRRITKEFEFEGFRFPLHWMIRVCIAECHRNPASFRSPEVFDPNRFLGPQPSDQIYSPFGIREHSCNGVELATMIATLFIEELAAYDIHLQGPKEPRRGLRHWMHWMPASTVQLKERA
jgi:cytochrome P450